MKKLIAMLLALSMIFSLAACTSEPSAADDETPTSGVVGEELEEFVEATAEVEKELPKDLKIAFTYTQFTDKLGSQFKNAIQYLCDGLEVEVVFFETGSGEEAVNNVESVLASGDIDGLIVAGATNPAFVAACDKYGTAYISCLGMPATEEELASCIAYDCYLGGITSDDEWAGERCIEALYEAGCRNICYTGLLKGLVSSHDARSSAMTKVVESHEDLNLLAENYSYLEFSNDVATFSATYPEMDGYGFTAMADSIYLALETAGIADGSVKISGVDISSQTGTYFQNGVQIWTCGGQYGVAELAFSIMYNYLADGTRIIDDPSVALLCPYIEITSYEDYENYVKYVENPIPIYTIEELMPTIHYFDETASIETFETYIQNYTLDDIIARHGDMIE